MLGTDDNPERAADMAAVETLEAEVARMKASAAEKQTEINKLERECGLDAKSKMLKKLEPITDALNSAVEKARPVVKNAADNVAAKAAEVREKFRSGGKGGTESEPAFAGDEAAKPGGAATSSGNSDNPYLTTSSAASSAGNSDNPYLTKLPNNDAESTSASTATSDVPTTSVEKSDVESMKELKAKKVLSDIERQEKISRIEVLKAELVDERTLIASRESEIAWLYKKHKVSQPNAFTKFRSNIQSSDAYQKMGEKLGVAKEKTSSGLKVASEKARSLWQSAGESATRMSASFREMMNKKSLKSSSSSSTSTSSKSSKADSGDMYARYS